MMEIQERFRVNIVKSRKIRGWSQKRLADESKIDRSHISNIETGKSSPSLQIAERIAIALKCDFSELIE